MTPHVYSTLSILPSSQKGQFYQEVQFCKKPGNDYILTGDPKSFCYQTYWPGLKTKSQLPTSKYSNVTSSPVVILRHPKFSEDSFRWSQSM